MRAHEQSQRGLCASAIVARSPDREEKVALYDSKPEDLKNEHLDAFYAALVAKLILVARERISRHHIQFLAHQPNRNAGDQPARAPVFDFQRSLGRMRQFEEALTTELSALRTERGMN
jgi:hypothetical protein